MFDIRKLKAGDLFYYVHSHWWMWELNVMVPYSEDTGELKAVSTDDGRIESINAGSLQNYYETREEAEKKYKDAAEEKIKELTELTALLETIYKEYGETGSFDTTLYKNAIHLAKGSFRPTKPQK